MAAMTRAFDIAPLTAADAGAAHGLTSAVGWGHRREDWLLALSAGHGLGAFDAGGALRGALMWFPHGPRHASIGMLAVDPSLHRAGIGRALMDRTITEAGDRALLLISTEAGRRLYDTLGFRVIGSNAAHTGTAAAAGPADGVEAAHADDLYAVTALDAAALGYPREALMTALATAGDIAVLRSDGRVTAFAICRRFGKGHVIGPVVGRTTDQARRLTAYWLARRVGKIVRIDVPAEHAELAAWLVVQGLPRGGESPIMVRGDAPVPAGPERRYALVSQAMG